MKTLEGIKILLQESHSEDYAKKPGMVYQIWEDGEITLQKSGSLLNQRTLHQIAYGFNYTLPLDVMPVKESRHGFAYVKDKDIAEACRKEIEDFFKHQYTTT